MWTCYPDVVVRKANCMDMRPQLFVVDVKQQIKITYEPVHEKTNNLHGRKQRRRSASR